MSRHGAIELAFGDGTYTFRLALGQIEEVEAKRDTSIFELAERLAPAVRRARLADIREVLRCGLIGAGMAPVEALKLVNRYVDERPIDENRDVAYAVVLAGLMRVNGDEVAEDGPSPRPSPQRGEGAEAQGKAAPAEPSGSTLPASAAQPL